ncbi:hypothetical protein, partial [Campylobacter molothri]|uniref:hypothetical protein n=1 Tax=Campylobacter molothri TaxID=1032242 RepID=UPI001F1C91B6
LKALADNDGPMTGVRLSDGGLRVGRHEAFAGAVAGRDLADAAVTDHRAAATVLSRRSEGMPAPTTIIEQRDREDPSHLPRKGIAYAPFSRHPERSAAPRVTSG